MSNFLAIAAVTATLRHVLHQALIGEIAGAEATAVRPDSASPLPATGVNIFLYQVSPSQPGARTTCRPVTPGGVTQRPRIGLDLHYLLTFYGDDGFGSQRVLGSVVRTLHARPVLTPDQIRTAISGDPHYGAADLAEEVERVRFVPAPVSLEELSNLWSIMFQTPYALSMCYVGSVVLIEAEETGRMALPVREPRITVSPFQRAVIERVVAVAGAAAPIVFGDTIVIEGSALDGMVDFIRVGAAELLPEAGSVRTTSVRVTLDDPALRAGAQAVQIVYASGAESTVAAFVLRPRIAVGPADAATIAVEFEPSVGRDQRVVLHLNEYFAAEPPVGQEALAYSFTAPPGNGIPEDEDETDTITVAISGVAGGITYLLRVQVSGAASVLTSSMDGGPYDQPVVTIP